MPISATSAKTSTERTTIVIVAHRRLIPARSQPVGDRIEQIGERHAHDEGQKDAAEHPKEEQQEEKGAEPEDRLNAKIHGVPAPASPGPPAMCLSHSTR